MINKTVFIIFAFFCLLTAFNCTADLADKSGEALSKTYCASCHLYPEPETLDRKTWTSSVLPEMGKRLGIPSKLKNIQRKSAAEIEILKKANIYPDQPALSQEEWQRIVDFYFANSPEQMKAQASRSKPNSGLPFFKEERISLPLTDGPITSYVGHDTLSKNIWIGDGRNKAFRLNHQGKILEDIDLLNSPIKVIEKGIDGLYILCIGFFHPNDEPRGSLLKINEDKTTTTILSELSRPVDLAFADLDNDSEEEIIICGFGYNVGKLSVFKKINSGYQEQVLKAVPGATKVEVLDFDGDGLEDLVVLFAQGDEGISVFYNRGKMKFEEKRLLRFKPEMGSNHFELTDFDLDGDLDILHTCGDNADISIVPKAYHGIRIFTNDGQNNFEEAYFYPMYGASKVLARDFDLDGDLDLAAIAFFTEYDIAPEEGFIYLENSGKPFEFKSSTFKNSTDGHWLLMDAQDIDEDGDQDILLGSFTFSVGRIPRSFQTKWQNGPAVVVLRNGVR